MIKTYIKESTELTVKQLLRNEYGIIKGSPEYVSGYFSCFGFGKSNNTLSRFNAMRSQLKSLKYSPKFIGNSFDCRYNQLTSLEYAPKFVGNNFYCHDNKVKFTEEDVQKVSNVKGNIYV
jgi:hypothetical protein